MLNDSDLFTGGAQFSHDSVYTLLINNPHALGRHLQLDIPVFAFDPESVIVDIG